MKVFQQEKAIQVLYESQVKLIGKSIQLAYDKGKNKYELPIFIINDPIEYIKPKDVVQDKFDKNKEIEVQMRFMGQHDKFKTKLSQKILFLYVKAKKLIEDSGQEFSPDTHEIQLIFRGKVMPQDKFLGNFLKRDGVIQVFKKNKHIE